VQQIKASPTITNPLAGTRHRGQAASRPDLTTVQPLIDAIISGNQVNVKWGWAEQRLPRHLRNPVDRGDWQGCAPDH